MHPGSRPASVLTRRALPGLTVFVLLAGCGAATGEASLAGSSSDASGTATVDATTPVPTVTATPTPTATARPAVTAAQPAPTRAAAVTGLPWPSATAAGDADLQKAVDGGSEPWLLDPTEVAESYGAFRGWKDVQASGSGNRVTVRSSTGTHTLTLAQPGRKGQGGIWLVTADSAG